VPFVVTGATDASGHRPGRPFAPVKAAPAGLACGVSARYTAAFSVDSSGAAAWMASAWTPDLSSWARVSLIMR
jgi:hypothetical protein